MYQYPPGNAGSPPSGLLLTDTTNPQNHGCCAYWFLRLSKDRLEALAPVDTGRHWVLARILFAERQVRTARCCGPFLIFSGRRRGHRTRSVAHLPDFAIPLGCPSVRSFESTRSLDTERY